MQLLVAKVWNVEKMFRRQDWSNLQGSLIFQEWLLNWITNARIEFAIFLYDYSGTTCEVKIHLEYERWRIWQPAWQLNIWDWKIMFGVSLKLPGFLKIGVGKSTRIHEKRKRTDSLNLSRKGEKRSQGRENMLLSNENTLNNNKVVKRRDGGTCGILSCNVWMSPTI